MNEHIAARKALEYLVKNKIDPSPVTFSVWFLYYRGDHKALISRMKSLLSTGQEISLESYQKIYEVYVLKAYFRESLGINRSTGQIIDKATDLKNKIQDFVQSIRGHQSSLGEMRTSLEIAETKQAIEIILAEALMELKTVESSSIETSLWMQKSMKDLNAVQHEVIEIEQSMSRDFLTGLPDRSYFKKTINDLLKESMSGIVSKRHFIVFDIEAIDSYNEQYSWLLGDSIIRLVVKIIQSETDETWPMTRLEEDEFAIFPPPNFSVHQIPDYVRKIQKSVNGKKVVVKQQNKEIKNISLNAAIIKVSVYDDQNSIDEKIARALKQTKKEGGQALVMIED